MAEHGQHGLSAAKAQKILHDKEVRGHPLTDRQRRFFGAVASGQRIRKDAIRRRLAKKA